MTRVVHRRLRLRGDAYPLCGAFSFGPALTRRWSRVTCKRCLAVRGRRR